MHTFIIRLTFTLFRSQFGCWQADWKVVRRLALVYRRRSRSVAEQGRRNWTAGVVAQSACLGRVSSRPARPTTTPSAPTACLDPPSPANTATWRCVSRAAHAPRGHTSSAPATSRTTPLARATTSFFAMTSADVVGSARAACRDTEWRAPVRRSTTAHARDARRERFRISSAADRDVSSVVCVPLARWRYRRAGQTRTQFAWVSTALVIVALLWQIGSIKHVGLPSLGRYTQRNCSSRKKPLHSYQL